MLSVLMLNNAMLSVIMLNVVILNFDILRVIISFSCVIILSNIMLRQHAEFYYADCRNAACHYAECRGALLRPNQL